MGEKIACRRVEITKSEVRHTALLEGGRIARIPGNGARSRASTGKSVAARNRNFRGVPVANDPEPWCRQ